jgi:hypothetical protein
MNLETAETITREELGEYDFLELVAFAQKVDYEGFAYACSDYGPRFARDGHECTADQVVLGELVDRFEGEVSAFWEGVDADVVYNAHIDEARKQERLLS